MRMEVSDMTSECVIFVSPKIVDFAEQLHGEEATEAIRQKHPDVWVDEQGCMHCHTNEDIYFNCWKVFRYKIEKDE